MLHILYKKLLKFYPQEFREQLAESVEQTFNDRYIEIRKAQQGLFGFTIWTFADTTVGIFREHLLLISPGDIMQTTLKTTGLSTLISFLLILPFVVMEVVNRRQFNEDFPFMLFFGLWLNLFVVSLILLPIVRAMRTAKHTVTNPIPTQKNSLLTNPKSALITGMVIILSLAIISLLVSPGGENPEQPSVFGIQVPSQFIAFFSLSIPIAAGIIASRPIISTLRAGGSLFAHPINLIIVIVISFLFAAGVVGLIMDQWPCFMGVPNCD